MRKVAVTGGLSSGKSTVCQFFKELGAWIISADDIVQRLLSPNSPIEKTVIDRFGKEIVEKGRISKQKLSSLVFADPNRLRTLEKILHPLVFDEIQKSIEKAEQEHVSVCVVEIPLLYETKKEGAFDLVISVYTEESFAKARFLKKTSLEDGEFDKRMKRQIPIEEKKKAANITICNNGTIKELREQVENIYSKLLTSI